MKNNILILFTLLVVVLAFIIQATTAASSCTVSTSKGIVNLEPLASLEYFKTEDTDKIYYLNVCKNAIKSCNGVDYPSIYYLKSDTTYCSYLGNLNQMKIKTKGANVVLEYDGGVKVKPFNMERRTRVTLICDKSTKSKPVKDLQLKFLNDGEEDGFHYFNFEMRTSYACPRRRIVGFGGAMLIIIPCLIGLYLIIGSLIMKFSFKKEGIEIFIHHQYILDAPKLVFEGFLFIRDILFSIAGKKSAAYQEVSG
jgi:hypothetical protein